MLVVADLDRAVRRSPRRRVAAGVLDERGRRGWLREAKKRLEAERWANPPPVPRDRPKRVKQAKRRLDEELWTEVRANTIIAGS